jgi:hypothetical protein
MTLTIKSNDTFTLIPATTNTALINLTQQSQLLNETEIQMTTTTTIAPVITNTFTRKTERKNKLTITYNDKFRVNVTTTHDKERKVYRTYVSVVSFELSNNFVIEKSIGSIFGDLFAKTIRTTPCNRFSQSSFDSEFANAVIEYNSLVTHYETVITHLLNGTGVITN